MSAIHYTQGLDDANLIELCNSGDARSATAAFVELYRRHKPFVLRVAQSAVHDCAIAVDAMQETFTWLLRQFPPHGDGLVLTARLTTLLYPVARNAAISEWRKAHRVSPGEDPDRLPTPPVYNDADVAAVLRELSPRHREVTEMRLLHDMSVDDIAAALDIAPGTVKSRLHAALNQLRNSQKIRHFFEK